MSVVVTSPVTEISPPLMRAAFDGQIARDLGIAIDLDVAPDDDMFEGAVGRVQRLVAGDHERFHHVSHGDIDDLFDSFA